MTTDRFNHSMEMEMTDMMTTNTFKPYELVWVREVCEYAEGEVLQYVGQVMSRETPANTYMVRRVPGHPGTLVELESAALARARHGLPQRLTHVSYAAVGGRGSFPVDMLRYDNCQPVNFDLVRREGRVGVFAELRAGHEGEPLTVAQACTSRGGAWTRERWSSFLWGLTETVVVPIGND